VTFSNNESKKALVVFRKVESGGYSGLSNRIRDLSKFIEMQNYEVELLSIGENPKLDKYDLVCISSFSNAFQIVKYRHRTKILWIDVMDSWKLTRRSLFLSNPIKETAKVIREIFGSKLISRADVVTYCSKRDAIFDSQQSKKVFVFPPTQGLRESLPDLGQRYVFVGPSAYPPNLQAYRILLKLAKSGYFDDVQLHVFGDARRYRGHHSRIKIHDVKANRYVYGSRDIHLVPIWSGAGIKYKTFDPLSYGLVVISSIEGANGISKVKNLHIAQTKSEFRRLLGEVSFPETPNPIPSKLVLDDDTYEISSFIKFCRSKLR